MAPYQYTRLLQGASLLLLYQVLQEAAIHWTQGTQLVWATKRRHRKSSSSDATHDGKACGRSCLSRLHLDGAQVVVELLLQQPNNPVPQASTIPKTPQKFLLHLMLPTTTYIYTFFLCLVKKLSPLTEVFISFSDKDLNQCLGFPNLKQRVFFSFHLPFPILYVFDTPPAFQAMQ